jgi:hypothetical protein
LEGIPNFWRQELWKKSGWFKHKKLAIHWQMRMEIRMITLWYPSGKLT